jgi:hypothetical protein
MLEQRVTQKNRLICAGVGASTETGGHAIDAQTGIDLVRDGLAAFGNLGFQYRRIIKSY